MKRIRLIVNGSPVEAEVEDRLLLSDFLREQLGTISVHVGCDLGSCGACTIEVDERSRLSCLMLAASCDGLQINTLEGLMERADVQALQAKLVEHHGLQCGYCTPGLIVSCLEAARRIKSVSREEIRLLIDGNLCRCTGYFNIVNAVEAWLGDPVDDR